MAAVSAPTDIRLAGNVRVSLVQYGATVAFGQPVYLDSADGKYKLCDANVSLIVAGVVGIAITPGVDTGYGLIATEGLLTYTGTTFVVGHTYFVGQTAGSVVPHADLTTSDWVSRIGTAYSATQIQLAIEATAIQHA